MKRLELILRILLGALFLWASLAFFFNLVPEPELTGDMSTFMAGLIAAKYLLPLIKTTELICGLALVFGYFIPLALVIIFPITINILMIHIFLAPEGLPIALFVFISNLVLAYLNRSSYKEMLVRKRL